MNTKDLVGREAVVFENGGKVHPGVISDMSDDDFVVILPCQVDTESWEGVHGAYLPSADAGMSYVFIHTKNIKRMEIPERDYKTMALCKGASKNPHAIKGPRNERAVPDIIKVKG